MKRFSEWEQQVNLQQIAQANGLRYIELIVSGKAYKLLLPDSYHGNPLVNEVVSKLLYTGKTQTEIAQMLGLHRPEIVRRSRAMGFDFKKGPKADGV